MTASIYLEVDKLSYYASYDCMVHMQVISVLLGAQYCDCLWLLISKQEVNNPVGETDL